MKSLSVRWLFILAVSLASFLLFLVEPMAGKQLLPWFGGGSTVWMAVMLFFQLALLGGYFYADRLHRTAPSRQVLIHLGVLFFSIGVLFVQALISRTPLLTGSGLKPVDVKGLPVWQILLALTAGVGVPFFLLSTTSSILQSWLLWLDPDKEPYGLYSVSNAASLLGLLAYPLWLERRFPLSAQAWIWSGIFGGFCVTLIVIALLVAKKHVEKKPAVDETRQDEWTSSWNARSGWISLAALSSIILLAGTNQVTQDIGSAPFLWVLPLGLYLLSYILAFSRWADRVNTAAPFLVAGVLPVTLWVLSKQGNTSAAVQIGIHGLAIFACCWMCHASLYRSKPPAQYLTTFYLSTAVGGALGGIFVNLIAPLVFKGFWEYPLSLACCGFMGGAFIYVSERLTRWWIRIPGAVLLSLSAAGFLIFPFFQGNSAVSVERNFYGVIRIFRASVNQVDIYRMVHGTTVHGEQALATDLRKAPGTYYSPSSGIGLVLTGLDHHPVKVGIIGMGVGTLAAYAETGDTYRFYELDPAVERLANQSGFFSYLGDSKARIEEISGDARLSLESELRTGSQNFDVLVVDAFSGDSIPTHLITREVLKVYLGHIKTNGIIAFHISNRYLDLEPVLAGLAGEYSLAGRLVETAGTPPLGTTSWWVILAREDTRLGELGILDKGRALKVRPSFLNWTDERNNLLDIMRSLP